MRHQGRGGDYMSYVSPVEGLDNIVLSVCHRGLCIDDQGKRLTWILLFCWQHTIRCFCKGFWRTDSSGVHMFYPLFLVCTCTCGNQPPTLTQVPVCEKQFYVKCNKEPGKHTWSPQFWSFYIFHRFCTDFSCTDFVWVHKAFLWCLSHTHIYKKDAKQRNWLMESSLVSVCWCNAQNYSVQAVQPQILQTLICALWFCSLYQVKTQTYLNCPFFLRAQSPLFLHGFLTQGLCHFSHFFPIVPFLHLHLPKRKKKKKKVRS